ncbi:ExbD/TolR family protein [Parasphingorhabdus sp. DH2-15]|uniref:ExbD/TolR family protein n=1 Tax=Parasphingorhabdus sp. DH2-15 TaxID=3444112 RepID=UPI003F6823D6
MGASLNTGGGRSRGRGGRNRAPMAEINVTPFVDVMLVLLIIFMITAPLLVAGVPIELPETRANPIEQERDPVQISIASDGAIYVDDNPVSPAELPALLTQIRAGSSGESDKPPQIVLRGDRAIDYGTVLLVMGELNRAGLNNISMAGINAPGN